MKMITIYSTASAMNMPLIKHALATADIPYQVTSDSLLSGLGVAALGNMGSDVRVRSEDVEKAKSILCSLDLVCG